MENQKIAELVSKKIYNVSETETDFAVQLLIEKLILPPFYYTWMYLLNLKIEKRKILEELMGN